MAQVGKVGIILIGFISPFFSKGTFARSLSQTCGEGQYLVRAHYRSGYIRSDGISVSPAQVSAHCRNYRTLVPPEIHFPENKSQNSRPWPVGEKRRIQEALKTLPKTLTHIGKVTFHRKIKSKIQNNPADVNIEEKKDYCL